MNRILPTLLLALGLVLGATPVAAQHVYGDAALVNGQSISRERLERFFEDYVKGKGRNIGRMIYPRVYKKLKREALDLLIEHEVLWQAAQKAGVTITDAEIDQLLEKAVAQSKSRADFLKKIELAGFTEQSYREYVRRELAGARYLREATADEPEVDEADIVAVYERNRAEFFQPETLSARHILIQSARNDPAERREAARQRLLAVVEALKAGADFAEMARRHSEDSTAANGGDLGEFTRGRMVPEFEAAAFALQPGEVSGVVETNFGFHLIKVEAHRAEKMPTLDEAREAIRNRLVSERRAERARKLTADLIAAAEIKVLVYLENE